MLFFSNDYIGSSELCILFFDLQWCKEGNGYLLLKLCFLFMVVFCECFNEKVVVEMCGVIDEQGYLLFWESLGKCFFVMEFFCVDYLCGIGQKVFIVVLMFKYLLYIDFFFFEVQVVIGKVYLQIVLVWMVLEKEGFCYLNYIDIFDGGLILECDIDWVWVICKSCLVIIEVGEILFGDWLLCLVVNEQYYQFCVLLVYVDLDGDILIFSVCELDMLKCYVGDQVCMVCLIFEEKIV